VVYDYSRVYGVNASGVSFECKPAVRCVSEYSKRYKRGCCCVVYCLLFECEEWRGDGGIRLLYICQALFLEIPIESQPHREASCLVSNVVVPSAVAPTLEVSSGCPMLRHAPTSRKGLVRLTTTNNDTPTMQ
jgi:hypothetical protein